MFALQVKSLSMTMEAICFFQELISKSEITKGLVMADYKSTLPVLVCLIS